MIKSSSLFTCIFLRFILACYISTAIAMMTIQTKYSVKRNWEGDPCAPEAFVWDGLSCIHTSIGDIQYNPRGLHRITAL